MNRSLALNRLVSLVALGAWLVACSFDSDLPARSGSAAPANSGVMLSGAGAYNDPDAAPDDGDSTRIIDNTNTNTSGGNNAANHRASMNAASEPSDRADAFAELAGGAASIESSTADAGEGGSSGAAGQNKNGPPLLWFSEYVEGSSSNKALEITALARAVLDGCKVAAYFNGKTEATILASLSGVLEANQVLTLCSSALKEKLGATCNQAANLTFNGDDAVALSCDDQILDVIGQIGVDPGDAWGNETNGTLDHTLRRNCAVRTGDALGTDAFDPATEWQAFPVDTFDGLGTRGC